MTEPFRIRWRGAEPLPATQVAGVGLLLVVVLSALLAPVVAPNPPAELFPDRSFAPPSVVRMRDASGFRAPFVYPLVLTDRLNRTWVEDRSRPTPLEWFTGGRLVGVDADAGPLLLLGADAVGRDVFSRLLHGARLSLGVTALGTAGALVVGLLVGAFAGTAGGRTELTLMTIADFILVLPATYVILVLRGVLPLVLTTSVVFALMATLFAFAAWPHVARGVRALVAAERRRDFAEAARAAGATHARLARQLAPAARGFLAVETTILAPALLSAEATISYLGLGFAEPAASWGTQLTEAATVRAMSEAPWLLAPAVGLFLVVLGLHLVGRGADARGVLVSASGPTGWKFAGRPAVSRTGFPTSPD